MKTDNLDFMFLKGDVCNFLQIHLCAKNQIDTPAVYNYNDVINQIDT